LGKGEQLKEEKVAVAGRVLLKRAAGAKLMFYDLRGDGTTVQILSDARDYEGEEEFKQIHSLLRRGTHSLIATLPRATRDFQSAQCQLSALDATFGASLPTFPIR
jgi:lysyl-tRNA synthetase class 2